MHGKQTLAGLILLALLLVGCANTSRHSTTGTQGEDAVADSQPSQPVTPAKVAAQPVAPPDVIPTSRSLTAAQILAATEQAGWQASVLGTLFGSVQETYGPASQESDFVEKVEDDGALRVYTSSDGSTIASLLFDTGYEPLADAAVIKPTGTLAVFSHGTYVAVVHYQPVSESLFDKLSSGSWSIKDLALTLGSATYAHHLHGFGYDVVYFLPQWAPLLGDPQAASGTPGALRPFASLADLNPGLEQMPRPTYAQFAAQAAAARKTFVTDAFSEMDTLSHVLTPEKPVSSLSQGKVSPGGTFVAGLVDGGLPSLHWLVIKQNGRAEQRYNLGERVQGFDWVDDHTLVYITITGEVVAVDAYNGHTGKIGTLQSLMKQLGITDSSQLWTHLGSVIDGQSPQP